MSKDIFTNETTFPLAEIFGPTIQGEGNYAGKKVGFIRFAGCDFRCSWCDSKYTHVVKANTRYYTTEKLIELVKEQNWNCKHIVITGGNPALYDLEGFIDGLHEMGMYVHIETQGTKWPEWLHKVDNVIISPKGPSSKMYVNQLNIAKKINQFTLGDAKEAVASIYQSSSSDANTQVVWLQKRKLVTVKIPIFNDEDYEWAKTLHGMLDYDRIEHFFLSVGNHNPHGDDEKRTIVEGVLNGYDWLVEKVINDSDYKDVSVLPQIHTLLWGNMVGK